MLIEQERTYDGPYLPTVVVLAGGKGTRIAHLYPELPKPLIKTAGEPFLHWVTSWLAHHGATDIIYSTGYRSEAIEAWVDDYAPTTSLRLTCVCEPKPLGTGGGVLNCIDLCDQHVVVANGDSLVDCDLAAGLRLHCAKDLDGLLFGLQMADASRYGTLSVDDGLLTAFHEKRLGGGLVNTGVYIFRKDVLRQFTSGRPCSIEVDLIPELLRQGRRIGVFPITNAAFIDIGTPETIAVASAFIQSHPDLFG